MPRSAHDRLRAARQEYGDRELRRSLAGLEARLMRRLPNTSLASLQSDFDQRRQLLDKIHRFEQVYGFVPIDEPDEETSELPPET